MAYEVVLQFNRGAVAGFSEGTSAQLNRGTSAQLGAGLATREQGVIWRSDWVQKSYDAGIMQNLMAGKKFFAKILFIDPYHWRNEMYIVGRIKWIAQSGTLEGLENHLDCLTIGSGGGEN